MNMLASRLSPSQFSPWATTMIRMDHTHVLSTFHQFNAATSLARKKAIVNAVCLALEIHAQLEEEIFYPALRAALTEEMPALAKSEPEHDEMRRLITALRNLDAEDVAWEPTFMDLMRDVMHHVADEETILLPVAERVLADRLGEIGMQMTRRRFQLSAPKAAEIASNTVRAMPQRGMLMAAGAVALGAYLYGRGTRPHGANGHLRHPSRSRSA